MKSSRTAVAGWFLILAVVLIVIALRLNRDDRNNLPGAVAQEHSTYPVAPGTSNETPIVTTPSQPLGLADAQSSELSPERQEMMKQALEQMNVPIAFYGRVIDQNSNGVPGVRVVLSVRQPRFDPVTLAASLHPKFELITDADGRFLLEDTFGDTLSIETVEKSGYSISPRLKMVRAICNPDRSPAASVAGNERLRLCLAHCVFGRKAVCG